MIAQKNIINKLQIGVNTPSQAHGMQLKDGLSTFFKEEIFPEMDEYFNSIQKNKSNIIRFDKLSIEINAEETDSLQDLKQLIISELKKIINDKNILNEKSDGYIKTTSENNELAAFLYFLEYGILPWWFEKKAVFGGEFFTTLKPHQGFSKKLKALLKKSEVRIRLMYQFDDTQLVMLVSVINDVSSRRTTELKIPKKYRSIFWESLFHFMAFKRKKEFLANIENLSPEIMEKLLNTSIEILGEKIPISDKDFQKFENKNQTLAESADVRDSEKKRPDEKTIQSENLKNSVDSSEINELINSGILVKNAGLILLHPFLKMFFEKLDLLIEKRIIPEKIDEAIHIMHYLATGREQPAEYELVFEKFLCNAPIYQPVNRQIFITKEQKLACKQLLEAVLEHWTALKSNSTEILQNEFLQREGKLTISEEKQNLFIQRKTQDLLLDRLPWNIHIIKLPWYKKILVVDW
ncbi:hypothetical protein K8089_04835 [Aequorivita sp. F47161]|uniref:Uncharacterized protein n=1 Tax=Aequorivita vitellina TaxID=2874475 RepID=A0A9X1TZP5_9FLAO|nr:contractile injection system tape measure protein [Aequorivita vitellina]MCG2418339.1 hypothetical protein [Aequorivita vitellina]